MKIHEGFHHPGILWSSFTTKHNKSSLVLSIRPTPLRTADHGGRTDLSNIVALIEDDLEVVNQTISDRLRSDIALINQLGSYIIHSGGKRLRPLTVLLSAKACEHKGDAHISLAPQLECTYVPLYSSKGSFGSNISEGPRRGQLDLE